MRDDGKLVMRDDEMWVRRDDEIWMMGINGDDMVNI